MTTKTSTVSLILLIGLSCRIFIDRFILAKQPSIPDHILLGLWQGIALFFVFTLSPEAAIVTFFAILAKLLIEFSWEQDVTRFAFTLGGAVLGAVGTDLLSRVFEDGIYSRNSSRNSRVEKKRETTPTPRKSAMKPLMIPPPVPPPVGPVHQHSDITSLDSNSDLVRLHSGMTPLDRAVAHLRARASLADSERRRFKEEKKWALAQGDRALAKELNNQTKKYKALMESFHREADQKMIEASHARQAANSSSVTFPSKQTNGRSPLYQSYQPTQPQPYQPPMANGKAEGGQSSRIRKISNTSSQVTATQARVSTQSKHGVTIARDPGTGVVNVDISGRGDQRGTRQSGGGVRVHVR